MHPAAPGVLFQQNHVGVYRSADHGDTWQRIDKGLPLHFDLALTPHARDPHAGYVIPLEADQYMFRATDGALRVWRSRKNGWRKLSKGLPNKNAHVSVLRQAMASDTEDPAGIYFGTAGGQVFASADEGASWQVAADFLPPIRSVTVAVIP